jgi:predicted lipoprotein with Yx(FWY)xxD motif
MKRKIRFLIAAAAPLAIALIAAGCGGSTSGSAYSSGGYGSTVQASAGNGGSGAAQVGVGDSSLGRIVVDSNGRTLYLFEKDKNGRSACYGQCATYWPPLVSDGNPVARTGAEQSLLGTIPRRDGSQQATYAGHPLYLYAGDSIAGDVNGEGSQAFGAGWDALSPAGAKIEADE